MSSAIVTGIGAEEGVDALMEDLATRRIRHVLLRRAYDASEGEHGEGREDGPQVVLVAREDLARFQELVAGRNDPAEPLVPVTKLLYGKASLGTGESEDRIIGRASSIDGVMRPSPADELIDLLLHCLLDVGRFSAGHRERLREIMAELRSEPASAGRAAERTQQELAPAITWDGLLGDVLQERWDTLLSRRRRLLVHLLRRRPVAALLRLASPRSYVRPTRKPPNGNGAAPGTASRGRDAAGSASEATEKLNRKQIRGSGLLLAGRVISTAIKFVSELLVVRYLTTAAYGSWTWALSAVLLLESFSTLGLNRAIPRFVPLHLERRERQELLGVLVFVLGSLLAVGLLLVLAFHAFPEWIAALAGASPGQSLDILFIVIFLIPIHGVGNFCTVLCAALGDSRSIFFRRYVLHPAIVLGIALTLVLMEADVHLLAYGWLFASLAGILYYSVSVILTLRRRGLLAGSIDLRMPLPVRRVLTYTIPVMGSDWFRTLMKTPAPLLLGYFSGMSTVALYQVVIPLVALNTQVAQSFAMMFEPSASRVLAKDDRAGLEILYWRSAVWVALLSFPGFAISFALAEPVTLLLYGERYQAAAVILSLLAIGTFIDAAVGFNDATLRVSGKIRWLMGVNIVGAALNIGLNLLLIPSMGALGAGIATGTAMLVYALLKQYCLWRATGVRAVHPAFLRIYGVIALLIVGLALLRIMASGNLWILLPGVLVSGLILALLARSTLSISDTFPELARWPLVKRLLG